MASLVTCSSVAGMRKESQRCRFGSSAPSRVGAIISAGQHRRAGASSPAKQVPERRVIGVDSTDLIWGLGSFHCISQQEPV